MPFNRIIYINHKLNMVRIHLYTLSIKPIKVLSFTATHRVVSITNFTICHTGTDPIYANEMYRDDRKYARKVMLQSAFQRQILIRD